MKIEEMINDLLSKSWVVEVIISKLKPNLKENFWSKTYEIYKLLRDAHRDVSIKFLKDITIFWIQENWAKIKFRMNLLEDKIIVFVKIKWHKEIIEHFTYEELETHLLLTNLLFLEWKIQE